MKTQANEIPKPILHLGNGNYHINYNVEAVATTDALGVETNGYIYDTVEIAGTPDKSKIITAVIREKYTQDQAEAIVFNYLQGKDVAEMTALQAQRELAKKVASGLSLKSDIDAIPVTIVNDRINDLELTTTAVIEVLTEKGITP